MDSCVFIYTAGSLGVSSFTGTASEFDTCRDGLALVWEMVHKDTAESGQELVNLMYNSATGSLTAKFSNGHIFTIHGARFHGMVSSTDAGMELLECIHQLGF